MSGQSGLVAIVAKEFRRFFTDKRMVITTLLLPGLMIYAVYSVMGTAMGDMLSVSKDYRYQVAAVNLPASLEPLTKQAGLDFVSVGQTDTEEVERLKQEIGNKNYDLMVVFPADFDAKLQAALMGSEAASAVDPAPSATANLVAVSGAASAPNVQLFYNSTRIESSAVYSRMLALLDAYKNAALPLFSINAESEVSYNLASEQDKSGFMMASMLPMLMMIFLFSGAMGIAPESIAGEKERGTIATILVTPLKRWELALGKIVSLSCVALLCGASSFIGVMASIPRLMGVGGASGSNALAADGSSASGEMAGALLYSVTDYAMLLLVIIATLLVFVGLISLLSAFARSVKEASTLVMPLMIFVMLLGALSMFSQGAQDNLLFYAIPVYNSVQCMVGIFSFSYDVASIVITLVSNLILAGLCTIVLSKMFNSERVVFTR